MIVWVVVWTGPDGHDPGPLECAVFSSEQRAIEFAEQAHFHDNEDWEYEIREEQIDPEWEE